MVYIDEQPGVQTSMHSLSRPVSSFHVIKATVIKDLINMKRYRANLIGQLISTLIFVVIFWFFSSAVEFYDLPNNDTKTIFIFYLTALALLMYDSVALWSPFQTVSNDLYNGTLEAVYSSPSSRYSYFVGSIIATAIINTIFFLPVYIALVFITGVGGQYILLTLLATLVTLIALMNLGIIIGLLAILWRQVGSIIGILGLLLQFMAGLLFPVASFPIGLRYFALLFPYTYGFDLLRYYFYQGEWTPLLPIYQEWIILSMMSVIMFFVSRYLLKRVEIHSKTKGLHLL